MTAGGCPWPLDTTCPPELRGATTSTGAFYAGGCVGCVRCGCGSGSGPQARGLGSPVSWSEWCKRAAPSFEHPPNVGLTGPISIRGSKIDGQGNLCTVPGSPIPKPEFAIWAFVKSDRNDTGPVDLSLPVERARSKSLWRANVSRRLRTLSEVKC